MTCPQCGQSVMQKKMIPVLRNGAKGYLCQECARKQIQPAGASTG